MNPQIELIIIRLENENLRAKRLLEFLADRLTSNQIDTLLEQIKKNNELINKLKQ